MPRRDDDLFDTHSIVPNTDDRAGHVASSRTSPYPPRNSAAASGSTSFVMQATVALVLLALIATCGFFHYRNTQQKMLNDKLQARIEALESQLGVTASAANQTSETLGEKVKALEGRLATTNTEISKLWAIANDKTKKALDEHDKALAALQASTAELKKSGADAARTASEARQAADTANRSVGEASAAVNALQQRIAQGDPLAREASQQAAMIQEQMEQQQAKLDALNKKMADHDESIRSIDSFRRSVNSDLGKLKQEHIGPASVPAVP